MEYSHIIVDGNYFARKAFYVNGELGVTKDGERIGTGVAHGFLSSLVRIKQQRLKEDGSVIIAWDKGFTRKKKLFPEYKANRAKGRDENIERDFYSQLDVLKSILKSTSFNQVFADGEEGDDVIASFSERITEANTNNQVLIISADKDLYQLINENVHVMYSSNSDKERIFDVESFYSKYSFQPWEYLIIQLMTGCKGDNVPGIKGVGEIGSGKILETLPEGFKRALNQSGLKNIDNLPESLSVVILKRDKRELNDKEKLKYWLSLFKITIQLLRLDKSLVVKTIIGRRDGDRLLKLLMYYEMNSLLEEKKYKELL